MRVIHIIPSAFDYFDDIRRIVFSLIDDLVKVGVESEAITIQYGAVRKRAEAEQKSRASAHVFQGNADFNGVVADFENFDVVHLHCPGLGAMGKIYHWKKNGSAVPLVASYYRDVRIPDFFSLLIKFYNDYYLPKILSSADAVVFPHDKLARYVDRFHLTKTGYGVKLYDTMEAAKQLALLYSSFPLLDPEDGTPFAG